MIEQIARVIFVLSISWLVASVSKNCTDIYFTNTLMLDLSFALDLIKLEMCLLVAYKVCPDSFHLQKVEEGNAKRVMERGLSDERLRPKNYYTNDEFPSVQTRNQFVLLDILLSCCVVLLRPRDCLSPGAVPCAYCNHHIVCAGHIKMLRNPFNGARKVHIADGGRKGPI